KVDPSDLQALQKLLTSPELAALQASAWPPVADQFVYKLTVAGRAQPIVIADSADNPPVLREVIDRWSS
ncbi:MAG: protealysin inhibitor emfourin, partial [Roseiflexaceae bacterium]